MGKSKIIPKKSLQLYEEDSVTTTERSRKEALSKNGLQQVFLQQSVTILAFKDKSSNNSTAPPDVLEPRFFLGILSEDIPIFVGAIIGATLIIVLFLLILTFWKCCCRMQLLKKKKYWLNPKDKANSRNSRHIFPSVVQSNSVLFLGLKSTHVHNLQTMDKNLEESPLPRRNPFPEKIENVVAAKCAIDKPLPIVYAPRREENGPPIVTTSSNHNMPNRPCLPISSIPVLATPVEPTYVNCNVLAQHLDSPFMKPKDPVIFSTHQVNNIPTIITQCDESQQSSPAFFHRSYYSGTFDQHSLYSCTSHVGSEIDLKTCSLTWSSYNLRPSSTADGYYDIFQRASLCKKRKNRMRSDIAAAIALNRSQSTQLNKEKDTDLLVENEVEIVLDERTTL